MNKERRKTLDGAVKAMKDVKGILDAIRFDELVAKLTNANGDIETVKDEEQDGYDNLSEGLQAAENGQKMEEAVNFLEEAHNTIDEALEKLGELSEIASKIEDAIDQTESASSV